MSGSDSSHLVMAAMSGALREPGGDGSDLPPAPAPAAPASSAPEAAPVAPPPESRKPVTYAEEWRAMSPFTRLGVIVAVLSAGIGFLAWVWPDPVNNPIPLTAVVVPDALAKDRTPEQLAAILEAIRDLKEAPPKPEAGLPTVEEAVRMFEAGDPAAARDLLERIREQKDREAKAAVKERARATRNLAAITVLTDKAEALSLYREATTLDPSDMEGWIGLGDAAMLAGTVQEAGRAFVQYQNLAERTLDERDDSLALERLGDVRVAQGDLDGALAAYEAGLAIAQKLASVDGSNSEWQRDLSVSHDRIGDVRVAQGDLGGALAAYEAGLAIAQKLASGDASNSQWQRDLSVSHEKIGDVREAQGDLGGALASYEAGLAISEKLASVDASNSEWQRDLSVSHEKIGDVREAQGDLGGALAAYEAGLAIRKKLASGDASNSQWQFDIGISNERIGDVLRAQGNLAGALERYQEKHRIISALASGDASNSEWQFDLGISNERIGDVLAAQGNLAGALERYEEKHRIISALASVDASNSEWQRDLSVSHNNIGDVRVAQGDLGGALAAYEAGLAIAQKLASGDASNSEWQYDLFVSLWRVAHYGGDRIANLERGLSILEKLDAENRLAPVNREWIERTREALKAARSG